MFGFGAKFKIAELERKYKSLSISQKKVEFPIVSAELYRLLHQAVSVYGYGYILSAALVVKSGNGMFELLSVQYKDLMNKQDYRAYFEISSMLHLSGMSVLQKQELASLTVSSNTMLLALLADEGALWVVLNRNELET